MDLISIVQPKNYVRPDEKEKGRYKVIDKVSVKLNEKEYYE